MSFILDALKKSDAKRRAGQPPELAPAWAVEPQALPTTSKPSGSMAILIAVVVVLLVIGWVGAKRLFETPQVDASALGSSGDGVVTDTNEQTEPAEALKAQIEASRLITEVSDVSADGPTAGVMPAEEEPTASPEPSATPTPSESPLEPAAAEALADLPLPSELATHDETSTQLENSERDETEPWTPSGPDYLYVWELPLDVRERLPALTLNVHVYAPNPADRFVLINGRRLREGQAFYQGQLRLAEIRPEGALVDYQDYRFLLSQ